MKKIVIAASLLTACVAFANPYAKQRIINAMNGYKDGSYGGAMKGVMAGQVKGMTEADMTQIADLIVK